MKTDRELEALLRSTLDNRAATITEPAELPDLPTTGRKASHRHTWHLALAAAAVVVLAAAGVLVGVHLAKDNLPAHPTPKPTPAPTACRTTLPVQWRTAFENSALPTHGRTTQLLSIAPDGSVLAIEDDGPLPGSGRFLVRLRPGRQPDVVYDVPDPDHLSVAVAQQYQHWLLIGLQDNPRPAKGTVPGSSALGLTKIIVFDLASHTTRTLYDLHTRGTGPAAHSDSTALYGRRAYWDLTFGGTGQRGSVRSYDLATGTFSTVYRGPIGYPQVTANGLGLFIAGHVRVVVPATLPAEVSRAVGRNQASRLATDGTAYAWMVSPEIVGWWAPGHVTPVYRRLPRALYIEDNGGAPVVAGRFVITMSAGGLFSVTDMLTGASADLPSKAGTALRPDIYLSQNGVLAGLAFTESHGHFVNGYWADAAMTVLRLDTNALPPLSC